MIDLQCFVALPGSILLQDDPNLHAHPMPVPGMLPPSAVSEYTIHFAILVGGRGVLQMLMPVMVRDCLVEWLNNRNTGNPIEKTREMIFFILTC